MTSRRNLKKQIKMICGDMAAECIMASHLIPGADKKVLNDCVLRIAQLQTTGLQRANVSFDKTPGSFESVKEYNKARKEYFAKAYNALTDGFNKEVDAILHEMNGALPKKK